MKNLIAKAAAHKILVGVAVVVIVGGGYLWFKKAHASAGKITYLTQAAEKTTITVSVSGTGQVSEENKIDLKPQSSGALVSLNVKQGDLVKAGQVIGTVDEKSALVSLTQAKASLSSAQANYDKVVAGTSSDDIRTAQDAVTNAQTALDNANTAYATTVSQQALVLKNAQSNYLNAGLAILPGSANTSTATLTLSGTYTGEDQGTYNISIISTGNGYYYSVSGLESTYGAITRGVPQPLGSRGLYLTFGSSGTISSSDTWTIAIPNLASSAYNTAYNSYQSTQLSQTSALNNAQQQITSAQQNLKQAQENLATKQEAADPSDVASARAQVLSAEAQVQSAENAYSDNILKAPFDGIVAVLNNQVGDQVSSASAVATIITKSQLAVISLNEVDVAKIKLGEKANLTFDAIDGLNLTGTVAEIDTIGTVSQGVVTYTVKIGLDTQDDRVKPGMSVSANIITDVKTDVIAVPNAAVKTDPSGASYVQELDSSGQPQNKTVEIGIANDTLTEITSGLNEGDKVVTQTINTAVKTTAASSSSSSLKIPGIGGTTTRAAGGFGGGGAGFSVIAK